MWEGKDLVTSSCSFSLFTLFSISLPYVYLFNAAKHGRFMPECLLRAVKDAICITVNRLRHFKVAGVRVNRRARVAMGIIMVDRL